MTASHNTSHLVANYRRFDRRFVRGEGVWLEDDQGRWHLDALSGIAVNALGHSHPGITKAISDQAGQLLHTSNLFHIGPQEQLAERICAASFGEQVYFCNSGAEANEAAFKSSRLWSGQVHGGRKPRLISAEGAFHGRTIGALSLTGTAAYREPFEPLPPVDFVPYGDVAALESVFADDVAALWLEPLQGEGGVRVPPAGYLARARELCDQHGALLVFDEVQVGCGRTGKLFAHEWEGVSPDAMCLAKGLGGGVPIGALVATKQVGELLAPGTHASTFGGNHLACAAANAVFDALFEDGFLDGVIARGEQLQEGLRLLFGADHEVRGRGLLQGVVCGQAPGPLLAACLDQGLVVGSAGSDVLRLAPPLVISASEIEELLQRLKAAAKIAGFL